MNLKIPAWMAILTPVILIFNMFMGMMSTFNPTQTNILMYNGGLAAAMIATIFICLGYVRIAKINNMSFLMVVAYITIASIIMRSAYYIYISNSINNMSHYPFNFNILIISLLAGLFMAVAYILLGIGILKLKTVVGGLATGLGIMYIVSGGFIITILFGLIVPLVMIAVHIMEAILFFNASHQYDK